jgi:hypothetical protein
MTERQAGGVKDSLQVLGILTLVLIVVSDNFTGRPKP